MTAAREHLVLGEVLRAMAADSAAIDEIVRAARGSSPEVARLPEAETHRHVVALLPAMLALFENTAEVDEQHFAEPARLGADRAAQGIPITALLRGVQAGRGKALEIAVTRGRAAGVPDSVLLRTVLDFDDYAGALERHVIDGYHTAELELARTAQDARTRILRALLHGDAAAPDAEDLAQVGLRSDGLYHCLVSDVTGPARTRALERRLTAFGGVFGLVEGRLAGISLRPPSSDAVVGDVLVVCAPPAAPHELRTLHPLCTAALRTAGGLGLHGLRQLCDLAGETALAAQPALAALLSRTLLGALSPGDTFHRQLALTALTYMDHGQRLDQSAAALHVHPNTVRYRLGRLAEITGTSLEAGPGGEPPSALHTLRWWWALHTWLGGGAGGRA